MMDSPGRFGPVFGNGFNSDIRSRMTGPVSDPGYPVVGANCMPPNLPRPIGSEREAPESSFSYVLNMPFVFKESLLASRASSPAPILAIPEGRRHYGVHDSSRRNENFQSRHRGQGHANLRTPLFPPAPNEGIFHHMSRSRFSSMNISADASIDDDISSDDETIVGEDSARAQFGLAALLLDDDDLNSSESEAMHSVIFHHQPRQRLPSVARVAEQHMTSASAPSSPSYGGPAGRMMQPSPLLRCQPEWCLNTLGRRDGGAAYGNAPRIDHTDRVMRSRHTSVTSHGSNNSGDRCGYCDSIGQDSTGHTKHNCPELKKLKPCTKCGASGVNNHTLTHCPKLDKERLVFIPPEHRLRAPAAFPSSADLAAAAGAVRPLIDPREMAATPLGGMWPMPLLPRSRHVSSTQYC